MLGHIGACDIGLKRIGLAIIIEGIVFPSKPILRKGRNQAVLRLKQWLNKENIKTLIVGLPCDIEGFMVDNKQALEKLKDIHSNTEINDTSKRILHFISLLKFNGDIFYINEENTSLEALEHISYMKRDNKKKASKDGRLDSLAACEILKRYLAFKNENTSNNA